jgi:hypothetical protein
MKDPPSAQEYVVGRDKSNKKTFGIFEDFCYGASSQHDGYHVRSTLQGFVHSGKLGGTQECNSMAFKYDVKVVILLLMVCFYQLNPIANTSVVAAIDVVGPDL